MLAVVAVILDHLIGWPSGGFVGVDVFFVISGFLITGILLREHERTDHISFVGFYRRRIKRIVPAATVVLILTVAAAFLLFNRARSMQTLWDSIWAFFFASNWHFAAVGTDYFQANGPVSPLQHFWSLSVEEQFYLVWPWLMLGVFAISMLWKGTVRRRLVSGLVMAAVVGVSFGWAMYQSAENPTVAYFSTFTRAWELGLGALLAIAAPWWAQLPQRLRPVISWLGLVGILISYFVINDTMPFPAPWALLPVAATALVIVGGTGGEQRYLYPLTNPVSFYVGNISYSLYLWHFPVIVFLSLLIPQSWLYFIIAPVLIVGLSVASYHLIELPVQHAPILLPRGEAGKLTRRGRRREWRAWRDEYKGAYKWGGLSVLAGLSLSIVAAATITNLTTPAGASAPIALPLSTAASASAAARPNYGPEVTSIQESLSSALAARSWPTLSPSLDDVIANDRIVPDSGKCADLAEVPIRECTWGDPNSQKTAVLAGDSIAMAMLPALLPTLAKDNWHIEVRAMYGCPFVSWDKTNEPKKASACSTRKAAAIAAIQKGDPDLLIVADTYVMPERADNKTAATPGYWGDGLKQMLSQVAGHAGQIILMAPPPADKDVRQCYTPTSSPPDCISVVQSAWSQVSEVEKTTVVGVGGLYVDTRPLFCVANSGCPAFAGTLPVKRDLTHPTIQYADHISGGLSELMVASGVKL